MIRDINTVVVKRTKFQSFGTHSRS